MARLNPIPRRSSTVDSLYRGRTPIDANNSDKENRTPPIQNPGSEAAKPGQPLSMLPPAAKKRRLDVGLSSGRAETPGTMFLSQHPLPEYTAEDERDGKRWYDPNQNPADKQKLSLEMHRTGQEQQDFRDDFISGSDNSFAFWEKNFTHQNALMDRTKQTDVARIDSANILHLSEAASKRVTNRAFGSEGQTVDFQKFITKCIGFTGADAVPRAWESDDGLSGFEPDWNALGGLALACGRRPTVPSFLLGPLSVEKRVRSTQRTARNRREAPAPVTRPEELQAEDLEKNDSNLGDLCKSIKERLQVIIQTGADAIEQELEQVETDEEAKEIFRSHHLSTNFEVSLFEFAINPKSFAQTIENFFYVSFLIRDGFVVLSYDEDELPTIRHNKHASNDQQAEQNTARHQGICSMDYQTWKGLVEAYDIKEPLIPHRVETATQVNSRGWYG